MFNETVCIYANNCFLNASSQVYLCTHVMSECIQATPNCAFAQPPLGTGRVGGLGMELERGRWCV